MKQRAYIFTMLLLILVNVAISQLSVKNSSGNTLMLIGQDGRVGIGPTSISQVKTYFHVDGSRYYDNFWGFPSWTGALIQTNNEGGGSVVERALVVSVPYNATLNNGIFRKAVTAVVWDETNNNFISSASLAYDHKRSDGSREFIGVGGFINSTLSIPSGSETYAAYFQNGRTSNDDFTLYCGGSTKSFFGGAVGIGTTYPGGDLLDVRGRAYASGGWQTTDADYAEWFEKEADARAGDIISINLKTGKVRPYQPGDKFIGICSGQPAFVGNRTQETDEEMAKTHVLVGLLGQVPFNRKQVVLRGRIIETIDGQYVGVLLHDGRAFIGR